MGWLEKSRVKSPWILHYDASSCNGCDIEVLASLTPLYDIERFGAVNVGNPKHADVLLITGSVNHKSIRVVKNIYEQMTEPKIVIAVGICATSGGVFHQSYNVLGGIDKVIPVDVYVPGCPPRPEAIIDALLMGVEKLEEMRRREDKGFGPSRKRPNNRGSAEDDEQRSKVGGHNLH